MYQHIFININNEQKLGYVTTKDKLEKGEILCLHVEGNRKEYVVLKMVRQFYQKIDNSQFTPNAIDSEITGIYNVYLEEA